MIASITLEDQRGRRSVSPADFPLSLGGADADIHLPGVVAGEPAAWLGMSEHELFIEVKGEAGHTSDRLTCNGVPVATSQWLHSGDVLRFAAARIAVEIRGGEAHLTIGPAARRRVSERPDPVAHPGDPDAAPAISTGAESPVRIIHPVEFRPARAGGSTRQQPRVRWTTVILAATVTMLAAVAWFAATARSVVIEIDPEPERMMFATGWSGVRLGERYLVRKGHYTLTAARDGYHDLEVSVEIGAERQQLHRFVLELLPGRLAIDTGKVAGAEVIIDGEPAGVTPLEPLELSPGEHEVRVVAERYAETVETIAIEGGGTLQTLSVDLASRAAAIGFSSRPAGATVSVDGNRVGVTPMTAELLEGKHRIAYSLGGHKPHEYTLRVEAGSPQDLPRVELRPLDGTVVLSSTPAGAAVTVDGTYRGETPLELALPPGRDHALRLTKPGHAAASRQVRVDSGKRLEMTMPLEVIEGDVEIAATPADARLYINGEAHGPAVAHLRLPAVPHEIAIRKEGYETYRATIMPRPGFPQAIEVTLETIEQARALPQRFETPQGQELILIQGGTFTMGAPRREPGRRANESLRQVKISRPFYISARVVTNSEFRRFRPAHESGLAGSLSLDADDYPVVQVTWEDAALYCNWLSEQASLPPAYAVRDGQVMMVRPPTGGYRLPSEAEWAWVGRYDDGPQPDKYPWGDSLPVAAGAGNYADQSAGGLLSRVIPNYDDSFPASAPVDSFQPNGFGLYNIGGNVAEWMHDIYAIYPSGTTTVEIDPLGPDEGELHVIRGSSWMDASISELRLTYRDYGKKARPDVGFRIVRYAE